MAPPTRSSRPGSLAVHVCIALAGVSCLLGASCDSGAKGSQDPSGPAEQVTGKRFDELAGVDLSRLTGPERQRWTDLVNEQLSPCGEPVSVARCVAESRSCSACVPAARYLVRLVAEGFESSEIRELYAGRFDPDAKLEVPIEGAPVRGAPMAPVTIVEFSDFECPYCGAAHPMLEQLLEEHEGQVKLVFKHYPLEGHKNAMPAARAAAAAQKQGKFWELADLLFEHQRELNPEKIRELAQQAGLEMTQFEADLASEEIAQRVEADKKHGRENGVAGTPTLFVNERAYLEPLQNLPKYVEEELAR